MDYEDIANVSSNFTEEIPPSASLYYMFHEIIFTLFCIVGIVADAAIIYTIFRFKRLRTKENTFLANWAIADLCSLVVTPSTYRIISVIDNIPLSPEFACSLIHIGSTLHMTVILFVIIVSIDWFIGAYFEKASEKLRSNNKYVIGAIWIFALIMSGITTSYCLEQRYTLYPHFLLDGSVCGLLIITIIFQLSRAVRKCQKKPLDRPTLKLTLTTSFVGCWMLAFLTFFIQDIGRLHSAILSIAECLIFGSSIVNLSLLYRYDINFQACLLQAIKRSGADYEESACSFDNPIVINRNSKDSVEIFFKNDNEGLLDNMY